MIVSLGQVFITGHLAQGEFEDGRLTQAEAGGQPFPEVLRLRAHTDAG